MGIMRLHKNSNKNQESHHLYAIIDKIDDGIFKYGISCEPIGDDGISDRMRKQINVFNQIDDWERFFAKIIVYDISGKIEARRIETAFILDYEAQYGRKPRGNIRY
jgi:URI fold toxin 2